MSVVLPLFESLATLLRAISEPFEGLCLLHAMIPMGLRFRV